MLRSNRTFTLLVLVALIFGACQPIRPVTPAQEPAPSASGLAPQPHIPRPDAPTYGVRGPYAVGVRNFTIPDPQRPLTATIWYPAQKPTGDSASITYMEHYPPLFPEMPIAGQAILNGTPDASKGPYPLVVFSHGNGFTRLQSVYLLEHLASYGFVVVAADHTGNNLSKLGEANYAWYIYRPKDIERVVAYVDGLTATGGALANLIDSKQMAIMGHSFGASTALRYAGAPLNFGWCVKNVELEKSFANPYCGELLAKQKELAQLAGLTSVPAGNWPAIENSRAVAVVALSPDYDEWGSEYESVTAIQIPALIMVGTKDRFNPADYAANPIFKHLSSQHKSLVTLEGADHLVFANACHAMPAFVSPDWYFVCSDPVWDMDRAHDLVNHFVTAFLLAELKGDKEAAKALVPENVAFPGIQYETTGFNQ